MCACAALPPTAAIATAAAGKPPPHTTRPLLVPDDFRLLLCRSHAMHVSCYKEVEVTADAPEHQSMDTISTREIELGVSPESETVEVRVTSVRL